MISVYLLLDSVLTSAGLSGKALLGDALEI